MGRDGMGSCWVGVGLKSGGVGFTLGRHDGAGLSLVGVRFMSGRGGA